MKYDGIIFDVDGTIWDSTPVVEEAWNAAMEEAGYDVRVTADRLKGLFGLPMEDIIRDLLPDVSEEERIKFAPKCYEYEHEYLSRQGGVIYEGVKEMMKELSSDYPLFIVSNCQAGYIELMLEKTGLGGYVRDHLCPGDSGKLKAANIRIICDRHGLMNPLYVGDTQMDANACKEAGVPICFAAYGFGKVSEPKYIIKSPMELTEILRS